MQNIFVRNLASWHDKLLLASVRVRLRIRLGAVPPWLAGDFKLASVKCLRLKNMEGTIVLAANSHGSAFALSLITEHPQPCAALIAKKRRAAGSSETFIAPTLLVGSSSGCLLSRQVQAYYSASFAAWCELLLMTTWNFYTFFSSRQLLW